jgi:CIC family chloride channel protein
MSASDRPLFHRLLSLNPGGKWFVLSFTVGLISGFGAIVFLVAGQVVGRFVLQELAGFPSAEAHGEYHIFAAPETAFSFPWLLAVLTLGGLVSGLLVYTFAPEAEGHGTDGAIDAFHNKRGDIPWRVAVIKTLASAVTLGTGGSGGREGPIAQIGAAFGSFLGGALRLSARDRRVLLAAGMGLGWARSFALRWPERCLPARSCTARLIWNRM